jgi:HEXXH motif-containing protein
MSPYITGALAMSIETLSQEGAAEYQERGVSFYSSDEIPHTSVLSCIGEALTIINLVPSVRRTVVTLVRSLHVIKPANEDYDVSFSEPQIPFSVFVSVPRRRIPNDAIRTAEAIVHEAMHLQLTLIERVVPLIVAISAEYNSPWKIEKRDVEGILQSVFVFATIDRFLDELLSIKNGRTSRPYIHHRQREIRDQIWRVRSFRDSNELTEAGCRLVTWLTDVDEYNRTSAITAYEA